MRACAVKVDDVVGVAGFVTPGMRVDVLVSGNPPGRSTSGGPKVKTLLQNIEVLSAGTDIQKDAEGKPKQVQVVNLLVTPEQAESSAWPAPRRISSWFCAIRSTRQTAQLRASAMTSLFADANAAEAQAGGAAPTSNRCRTRLTGSTWSKCSTAPSEAKRNLLPRRGKNSESESRHCDRLFLYMVL